MGEKQSEKRILVLGSAAILNARKASFGQKEPGIVEIGANHLNLILRVKGVPYIDSVTIDYDIAAQCYNIGLLSKSWKLNSYLELIDIAHVEIGANKTNLVSLEVVEWSNYTDTQQFWPLRIRSLSRTTTGGNATSLP